MRRRFAAAALLAGAAAAVSETAGACTTFCLQRSGDVVFAKNYDFGIGYGMLVVNKRGVAKASRVAPPESPARWVSRFGSLTFNQFGREFPSSGMNEAGLAVELMWLDAARYPKPDARPAVGVLEWIQFQLDNSSTVAEVVANAAKVRIASRTPLHYLVGDAAGGCASIEFLDGRLVAHSGATLPVRVLTNDTYASSLAYARANAGAPIPEGAGSLDRFARVARLLEQGSEKGKGSAVAEALAALDRVAAPGYTQWSIAWDLENRRVHFRTRVNRKVRTVALGDFDLSCATPSLVADVDGDPVFTAYSRAKNEALVEKSHRGVDFLRDTPASEIAAIAAYPDATSCVRRNATR